MRARGTHPTLVIALLTLILAACGNERGVQSDDVALLLGPSTATGTIVGTGASLYRRGTHVLLMEGHSRFYLESKQVDLRAYEGKEAVVRGEIAPNIHPSFLPVMDVTEVMLQELAASVPFQTYDVPSLGLTLTAPATWKSTFHNDCLVFTTEGATRSFLTLERGSAMPEGFAMRIGGRNGMRVVDEVSGVHRVYIRREADVLLFTFDPRVAGPDASRDAFYALLQSVRFPESASSGISSSADRGDEIPFIPCGGPAHVLCPPEMFCEVREADTGIGACRRVGE